MTEVENNKESWADNAVFLTGIMKSGTTLLLSLLDGHSKILSYPAEPSFYRIFVRKYQSIDHLLKDFLLGTPNPLHYYHYVKNLEGFPKNFPVQGAQALPYDINFSSFKLDSIKDKIELSGIDFEKQKEVIDLPKYLAGLESNIGTGRLNSLGDVLKATIISFKNALKAECHPKLWAFKQPCMEYNNIEFKIFFDYFKNGKSIVIIRDPRGYIASYITHYEKKNKTKYTTLKRLRIIIHQLRKLEQTFLQLAELKTLYNHGSILYIFYEDLVLHPKREMEKICNFLRINFEPILLQPTKLGINTQVATGTMVNADEISITSVDRWKQDLSTFEILLIEAMTYKVFNEYTLYQLSQKMWKLKIVRVSCRLVIFLRDLLR